MALDLSLWCFEAESVKGRLEALRCVMSGP